MMVAPIPDGYEAGGINLKRALVQVACLSLLPPPKLTVSEWAERYAYLSPETSAKHGKFHAFAYQNGIMDAVSDPTVETITVMKSARIGYTKVLDNIAGFFVHQDPCPMLIVQPRVEDAEDYSRTEIAPMLRDTPVLAKIAGDLKAKDSDQRVLKRLFKNGSSISFVGANSPGGFRRITARIVAFDEVDGYPTQGAGVDGDQIMLGTKRSESFWNRKIILGSTPTVKGISRIEKSWGESDQRRYFVPCPHCNHMQTLKWSGIRWESGQPATAHYVCEENGCVIEDADKPWMIAHGEWRGAKPFTGHAGFHIWAGYSLFPNAAWRYLAEEFLRVKSDPSQLKTFVNLVLGETWEENTEKVDGHALQARTQDWPDCPDDVLVITCGIDVQNDRFEIERVGWAEDEESWSLDHKVIYGDPAAPEIWADLDAYLHRTTIRADGTELPVHAACVDSGGHHTQAVYRFTKDRVRRRIHAIKGVGGPGRPVWPRYASKVSKGKINLFLVGVDAAKDAVYARLKIREPGPGYCHFPKREPKYFEQLTAEVVQTKYVKGFPTRVYVLPSGVRNEALDCRVYAYAGLQSLNVRWGHLLAAQQKRPPPKREAAPSSPQVEAEEVPPAPAPQPAGVLIPARRARTVRRSSWMS